MTDIEKLEEYNRTHSELLEYKSKLINALVFRQSQLLPYSVTVTVLQEVIDLIKSDSFLIEKKRIL